MLQGTSSLLFRTLLLAGLIAAISSSSQAAPLPADSAAKTEQTKGRLAGTYGKLPLSFEANQGQSDPQVKFQSRGQGYSLFLTDKAAVFALSKRGREICQPERSEGRGSSAPSAKRNTACPTQTDTLNLELTHSNPSATPKGAGVLPGHANYFLGNDPAKWHTNVPTFSKVVYTGVYDGIDLVYYGNQCQLEYDFVVEPGSDPKQVELHFTGAEKLKLTSAGDLEVIAKNGQIAFRKPKIYQTLNGQRQPIQGSFTLAADHCIRFLVGSYDRSQPLVIDPVLVYSTYLGGSVDDLATGVAADAAGNFYLAGTTDSPDFPVTTGSFQTSFNSAPNTSAFIAKFNPLGTALLYSTYLAGTSVSAATALAVDASGNAYVTGNTYSGFPVTSGAYQTADNETYGPTSFVAKLNADGNALLYASYLGGSGPADFHEQYSEVGDFAYAIAVDSSGNAYVGGTTFSTDFPVSSGALQTTDLAKVNDGFQGYFSGSTGFVSELNAQGSALVYSTYLGGSGQGFQQIAETVQGIAVDASGDAYVTGSTVSQDFPVTSGAFQSVNKEFVNRGTTGFISKLNPTGTALLYSTFLGGSGNKYTGFDASNAIAIDSQGNAYVTGSTNSFDFPVTPGAFQMTNLSQAQTAYVAKMNPTGSALVYATYLGGTEGSTDVPQTGDIANAIAVDAAGNAYVAGSTNSTDFPATPAAFQTTNVCQCRSFFTQINPAGSGLGYSTLFGGTGKEIATAVALDTLGNAYVAGNTSSTNLPISKGAIQRTNKATGKNDSTTFLVQWSLTAGPNTPLFATTTALTSSIARQRVTQPVTFTATVAANTSTPPLTGSVDFLVDGSKAATVPLSGSSAAYTSSALTVGAHTITAHYTGATGLRGSLTTLPETIYMPTAARPGLSLKAGSYIGPQTEIISDATSGAAIYYTTDGSVPTTQSKLYSGPLTLNQSVTIQAAAFENGYTPSAVVAATYSIQPRTATPTFSPVAGTYTGAQVVRLADTTAGAVIYYTTNGTAPTASSTQYTASGILVGVSETIKAIAIGPGDVASSTATAAYTILPLGKAATPTFSPTAGTYTTPQSTTISDTTPWAVIHYTTDNSTPTTASPVYSGTIAIANSETIKAIAVAPGYAQSLYGIAKYVIAPVAAAPVFDPPGGTYTGAQTISMSSTTPNSTVFYHIDGVTGNGVYISYTKPITIYVTSTIQAFTMGSNNPTSPTTVATYTIQ